MSIRMLLLACLAGVGRGRRMQVSPTPLQDNLASEDRIKVVDTTSAAQMPDTGEFKPETALTMLLLASNPAAAWNPSGAGIRFPAGTPSPTLSAQLHHARSPSLLMVEPDVDVKDRVLSAAVYILPWAQGFEYGKFAAGQIELIGLLANIFGPLIGLFQGAISAVPFGSLLFFIVLASVTNSPEYSTFLRFNVLQALVLSILLQIVQIVDQYVPSALVQVEYNTVFYALAYALVYAWQCIARGVFPDKLPVVSDAASQQFRGW